ncbi:MAG TPA: dihydrodipicolinate synthase family protein [Geminicoccus sp.]|uniref:dihydrodipicolinate synthase family protein n=1 Tax=Geminicoccus sp. TaxID=2024832 RepID=UPI002D193E24|nr:dihydrodipicolinate synthase family protein [Geminicoccus sp.]HWL68995.1 dihydrodipicolinate synthase family protein [Geminicoccus sp.]
MTTPAFSGIWPILYAFFDEQDRLDEGAVLRQVEVCITAGADGIAALGLATEVAKLSPDERGTLLRWLARAVDGRVPVAVTVFGESEAEQIDFARMAAELGASWVILQPPPRRPLPEDELLGFFGRVIDACPIPAAIQNAPDYLGVGLSDPAIRRLKDRHPNFLLLKGEGSAVSIRRTIDALKGEVAVFNGRGGLELPDILRAGCAGMIPAPELVDVQVAIWRASQAGDWAEADRLYAEVLPLIVFVMQSIPHLVTYGKRAAAHRLGLGPVHDRLPGDLPTPFGLAVLDRLLAPLPPLL